MAGGHAWQVPCMAAGLCMAWGCAWQGACIARGMAAGGGGGGNAAQVECGAEEKCDNIVPQPLFLKF